ncbi:flippase [Mesobacillus subterraneus]|uniref:flippase n=1 Tax=Mesobacillus subterraneus TaxID=285983 RepID=UPI00203A3F8E|nr:flippase [Mesobacillus subterraneus]MCM3574408.1 flippase [Mesobacillus subterraneus]
MKKSIGINTLFEIVARILNFIITIVISRFFGAGVLGTISSAQAISAYVTLFGDFGTSNEAIRSIASDKKNATDNVNLIYTYRFAFTGLLFIILFLLVTFDVVTNFVLIAFIVVALMNLFIPNFLFIGLKEFKFNGYLSLINTGIAFILFIIGVTVFKDYHSLPIALIIATSITILFSLTIIRKRNYHFSFPSYKEIKSFLLRSYYIGATTVFGRIYYDFDIVILALLTTQESVGLYSASFKIIQILWFIPQMYVTFALPIVTSLINENEEKLKLFINNVLLIVLLFNSIIIFIAIGYSEEILITLFGEEFSHGSTVLFILLIAYSFQLLKIIFGNALIAFKEEKYLLKLSIMGTSVNVISNFALIPMIGILGAAISTAITELILLILEARKTYEAVQFKIDYLNVSKLLISLITTVIFSFYLQLSMMIELPMLVLVFLLLLFALKENAVLWVKKYLGERV